MLYLQERRRLRLYLRQDEYGRYYSALVYLPRDRYTTGVRLRLIDILKEELGGTSVDFTAWNTESILSRLHFVVRVAPGTELPELTDADVERIEARLVEAARSWADGFAEALNAECGEERAAELLRRYGHAFPEGYKADHTAARRRRRPPVHLEALKHDEQGLRAQPVRAGRRRPRRAPLQDLPHRRAGLAVRGAARRSSGWASRSSTSGRTSCAAPTARIAWIYDFGLRMPQVNGSGDYLGDDARERFQDAFAAMWTGEAENDGFNALVLRRRPELAAGDGAARVRQVPAAGRLDLQPGLHGGHPPQQRPHHPAAGLPLRGPDVARTASGPAPS